MRAEYRLVGLLGLTLVLWLVLFALQAAAGPRDGWVPAHLEEPGWGMALGPILHDGVASGWPPSAVATGLPILLLLAPLATVVLIASAWSHPAIDRSPLRLALLISGLALGLLCFWNHSYLSNDLHLFRSFGEMLHTDRGNPYRVPPAAALPPSKIVGVPWALQPATYGPAAQGLFRVAVWGGKTFQGELWLLKLLIALPWVATLLTVWVLPGSAADRWRACIAVALSPVLLLEIVQNAHLEGWIGWLLLLAILVMQAERGPRPAVAGLLFGMACAVKPSVAVAAGPMIGHLLWSTRYGSTAGRRRGVLGFAGVGALVVFVAYASMWQGFATFEGLRTESEKLLQSVHAIAHWAGLPAGPLRVAALCGNILAMVVGLEMVRRGASLASGTIAALAVQMVLGRTFLQPWYLAPILLLWPATRRGEKPGARVWWTASVSFLAGGYGPFFFVGRATAPVQTAAVAIMLLPPLLVALWSRVRG